MRIDGDKTLVWDPFVRTFHWSLVLAYLTAWATAEEWAWLHERAGYFLVGLIGLRLIWGVIGTRYAVFSSFVRGPASTLAYLRSLQTDRPEHYLGHNPAGGWMVIALLACLVAAAVSGVLVDSGEDGIWEEIHEACATLSLFLVAVHVAGVLVAGLIHGENLIRAMITGNKIRRNADV